MTTFGSDRNAPDERIPSTGIARTRPRQATIASVLLMVFGLLGLLTTWVLLASLNDLTDHGEAVNPAFYALCYIQFAVSGLQIASGWFVFQGRAWARTLAVVLCGVNILGGVVALISGAVLQAFTGIILNVGLIATLNRDVVREWCE